DAQPLLPVPAQRRPGLRRRGSAQAARVAAADPADGDRAVMRRWPVLLLSVVTLAGCERVMRNMYQQPRYDPGESSPLFADGKASRAPPPGSVVHAMGDLAATSSGRRGESEALAHAAAGAASAAPPFTRALLL